MSKLDWAEDIVVVDSLSTDDTVPILQAHPRVRTFQRAFDSHAGQWNFGLNETNIATEWVLALDADYVLTDELIEELRALEAGSANAFRTSFQYCVFGKPLRGSVYPPVTTLFRRQQAEFVQDGHTQRLRIKGPVASLKSVIRHDDRKPLSQWLAAQDRYMRLEAAKLAAAPRGALGWADRLRLMIVIAPVTVFLFCLFPKRGILDGLPGLYYALQRTLAEMILSLHLLERRFSSR